MHIFRVSLFSSKFKFPLSFCLCEKWAHPQNFVYVFLFYFTAPLKLAFFWTVCVFGSSSDWFKVTSLWQVEKHIGTLPPTFPILDKLYWGICGCLASMPPQLPPPSKKKEEKKSIKPSSSHSISILTNISTQFLLQSCVCVCVCVCLYVCVCTCSVCVCVCFCFVLFCTILYVNRFGRTMLYMCIEYHI